jgi:hypothetical protein
VVVDTVGLVDRLNGWVLDRLGRSGGASTVEVTSDGISWRHQGGAGVQATWGEIKRVVAMQRPAMDGDTIALLFELDRGAVVECDSTWEGWATVTTRLERWLPNATPYADWMTHLVAGGPAQSVTVFSRP